MDKKLGVEEILYICCTNILFVLLAPHSNSNDAKAILSNLSYTFKLVLKSICMDLCIHDFINHNNYFPFLFFFFCVIEMFIGEDSDFLSFISLLLNYKFNQNHYIPYLYMIINIIFHLYMK